jgi:hypothetical protein
MENQLMRFDNTNRGALFKNQQMGGPGNGDKLSAVAEKTPDA